MKKLLVVLKATLLIITVSSCGLRIDANKKLMTGEAGISSMAGGTIRDNDTGDIIATELDEYGNSVNCSIGKSSNRRSLPSCNAVVEKRVAAQVERQKQLDLSRREQEAQNKVQSDALFYNSIDGTSFSELSSGLQLKATARARYNDEFGSALIVNLSLQKISGSETLFKDLFTKQNSFAFISFLDRDGFELLDSLKIPLSIEKAMKENVKLRRIADRESGEIKEVKMQVRKSIRSIREYTEISSLEISVSE